MSNNGQTLRPTELEKRRWMLGSTLLNALLAAAKLAWGLFSGSTVVLADAIHSLSDVIGALLVYAAVRLAPRHSARFPLGLYKLEDMAAVAAGLGVLLAGYEILRSVFAGDGVSAPSLPGATLVFIAVVTLTQLIFYRYERRAAARLRSPGLNSDVANWLGDIGASFVVIVGVGGHMLAIPYAQEVAVVIIALLIFHSAYEVLHDGLLALLDASTAQAEEAQARALLEATPAVAHVGEIIIRKAGSALFLKTTLSLDTPGLSDAHHLVDEIEARLKQAIPQLERVTIHYEPVKRPYRRVVTLYDADSKTPARAFGNARCLLLEDVPTGNTAAAHRQWLENPYAEASHGKAMKLAAWLIRNHVDELRFTPTDEQASTLIDLLGAAGIQVRPTETH